MGNVWQEEAAGTDIGNIGSSSAFIAKEEIKLTDAPKSFPSKNPTPAVNDPHPGSVSDGIRPDADETGHVHKDGEERVRKDGAGVEDPKKREQAVDPALMPFGDPAGAA
ncbi:MAG: hypothetical protein ACOH2J_15320 [Allorhizobium sp.]